MKRNKSLIKSLAVFTFLVILIAMLAVMSWYQIDGAAYAAASEEEVTDSSSSYYNALLFDIDTGTYVPGTAMKILSNNYPEITLSLSGSDKRSDTRFEYLQSATIVDKSEMQTQNWVGITSGVDFEAVLDTETIAGTGLDVFSAYFYFRTVLTVEGIDYYYISPAYVDVILDRTGVGTEYGISTVDATYINKDNVTNTYNADSSTPEWVAYAITFSVTSLDTSKNNTKFYYSLDNGVTDIPFTTQTKETNGVVSYYSTATINRSYDGEVQFYACSLGEETRNFVGRKYIRIDLVSPLFTVSATTVNRADVNLPTISYVNGTWANGDVTYTLTRDANSIGLSAMSYYVYNASTSTGFEELLPKSNGVYSYTVTSTTNRLIFKAVNDAGTEYLHTVNFKTSISTVVPKINLIAEDGRGADIRSAGTAAGTGYRVGYASDAITFTMTDDNAVTGTNEAKVTFEYAVRETVNGVATTSAYTEMTKASGNYQLNYTISATNAQFKNRTYIFRLRSEAGYTDVEEFTVSVLNSNYQFNMDALNVKVNAAGWVTFDGATEEEVSANAALGVPVSLYVESFLGIDDEYEFYSQVYGDNTTRKQITNIVKDNSYVPTNGMVKYIAYITQNLQKQQVQFYVYNKADDRSQICTTQALSLDAAKPVANVVKKVDGKLELFDGEWANGSVHIQITPTASLTSDASVLSNISGVKCYLLMNNVVASKDIALGDNGYFNNVVQESDTYTYRLISGAGVYTDVKVEVNIDTATFAKSAGSDWLSVFTIAGEEVAISETTERRYVLNNKTAEALRIKFNTTHGSHITYSWAEMENNVVPDISEFTSVSNLNDEEQSFVFSIKDGETGTVSYVFNLYSKAKDSGGSFSSVTNIVITITYDNATFSIEVSSDQLPNIWTNEDVTFTLVAPSSSDVASYQIRLGGDEEVWKTISLTNNAYVFTGVEQVISRGICADITEESVTRSYGYSYCGDIWFRAISTAGKASQECFAGYYQVDKVGETVKGNGETVYGMHPLYSVYQETGSYVVNEDSKEIYIYSNSNVYLQSPEFCSDANVAKLFAESKSDVTYYYGQTTATEYSAPLMGSLTPLVGSVKVSGGAWYWIYAYNTELGFTTSAYKVYIAIEDAVDDNANILTAEFDTEAGVGSTNHSSGQGYFVFSWSNTATVLITVDSGSPVYYWYKIGNGGWKKFNAAAGAVTPVGGIAQALTFVGEETANSAEYVNRTDVIKEGNLRDTVSFRVTNLAGNVVYIDTSCEMRIEDSDPEFDITLLSTDLNGDSITIDATNSDALSRWYPNAIQVIITPTAENPGGVVYTYQEYSMATGSVVGIGSLEKLPGNGKNFTTDDLSIFQDSNGRVNGALYIIIVATATATNQTFTYRLVLKIDKTEPVFSVSGSVTIDGVEKTLASGTWTNATGGVTMYRHVSEAVQAGIDSASGVTYQYVHNGSTVQTWDSSSLTENSTGTYVFTATTGAGRTYTYTYEVRIDTTPPVINSGNIVQGLSYIATYYIDQTITYVEDNLKYAKFNNFPLTNGQVIATDTVESDNGGYVHIVIEDEAGNVTELEFYMAVFPLNVNSMTLSEEDLALLTQYETDYIAAKSSLTSSRQEYFAAYISRLWDRVATLKKQRDEYRAYLTTINTRIAFTLQDDYPEMYQYINYFTTDDVTIRYDDWLQEEIRDGVYDTYYEKLETEFAKLQALMTVVTTVETDVAALPATNVVEEDDYQSILRVYNEYESLSTDQKSVFTYTLYNKLLELKRKCELLLLQDETTGVSIDGDDLAAGVEIEVVSYASSTELYNNAQRVLLETVGTNESVVSISKISLTGNGSTQDTGTITVTIAIPDAYQSYIYFAVYKLATDGTITPISGSTISADGKSVYFTDNSLNTYILATKANLTVNEESKEIYGTIAGIEIDATLLTYITFVAVGMFVVLVIIIIIMGVKRRGFFHKYNKAYKNSIKAKGIEKVPKGNAPVRTYPNDPETKYNSKTKVYTDD